MTPDKTLEELASYHAGLICGFVQHTRTDVSVMIRSALSHSGKEGV